MNVDATAVNAPSMARLRLALPSVAGHCWGRMGCLRAPKFHHKASCRIPCPLSDYGFGKPMEGYNNEPDGIGGLLGMTELFNDVE